MIQVIGKEMIQRKRGRIAVVASVCAFTCIPGLAGYQASKYAARALCDSLKYELEVNGVTIHLFTPGTISTPGLVEENKNKPPVTWEIESTST